MFLPGAAELGMTHSQCLGLLESVEDTIDFFVSGLTYLIYAESQKAQPNLVLIAQWEAMDSEAFDLQYRLHAHISLPPVRIPRSSGHPFHEHLTTDSTVIWPPIPRASGH